MGSSAIPNAQNVPLLLCHGRFNEASLPLDQVTVHPQAGQAEAMFPDSSEFTEVQLQLGCSGASMQPERCHLFEVLYQDVQLT
jgi:hypothetical protein